MTGTRTAVALYVALALHALAGLVLLLMPGPQGGKGRGQGHDIGLRLEGSDSVLAAAPPPAPVPVAAGAGPARRAPRRVSPIEVADAEAPAPRVDTISERSDVRAAAEPAFAARVPVTAPERGGGGGAETYFTRLRLHLYRFRRDLPGEWQAARALVGFTVSSNGEALELRLVKSSGLAALDAEAQDLIRRAVPLPRPPGDSPAALVVPIEIDP